jgi:DNA-binding NtrC family response regulator
MKRALIACAKQAEVDTIRRELAHAYRTDVVNTLAECLRRFQQTRYDLTFLDLSLLINGTAAPIDYNRELMPFWDAFPTAEIIVLVESSKLREAVHAVKAGASTYLSLPVDPAELRYIISSLDAAAQMEAELDYLRGEFWKGESQELVRTRSPIMREVVQQLQLVAPTRSTVLLRGETGTGKSLLAKLVHRHSNRADSQFVSVHCGAMPESLIESELFGHEKGAFTGATQRRLGKFEIAHRGTIFLDEIGTLSPAVQVKLLQVLQDRTLQRVGGESTIEVDVRIIAATNIDLEPLCDQGRFRRDLFYRLSVFPITLPALRDRREDIELLADLFIRRFAKLHGKPVHGAAPSVLRALQNYTWPGNVRELENVIERAFILERSNQLTPASFPAELFATGHEHVPDPTLDTAKTLREVQHAGLDGIRQRYLNAQLAAHQGRIGETAQAAGITPRQLHKLMSRYDLHKEDFRPQ